MELHHSPLQQQERASFARDAARVRQQQSLLLGAQHGQTLHHPPAWPLLMRALKIAAAASSLLLRGMIQMNCTSACV